MNATKQIRSVAETYFEMQNPAPLPAPVVRPTWVPASITESELGEFTKLVIEARTNGVSLVEFKGVKYAITEAAPADDKKADDKKDDAPKAPEDKKDDLPKKGDDEQEPDGDEDGDDPDGDGEDPDHDGDGVAAAKPALPDAKAKKALAADKFESYESRGASILSVAQEYVTMNQIAEAGDEKAYHTAKAKHHDAFARYHADAYHAATKHGLHDQAAFHNDQGISHDNSFDHHHAMALKHGADAKDLPSKRYDESTKPSGEVIDEGKASAAKGGPEVTDASTKKVVDDAQAKEPVVEDPAKKKPEVKVEKKAEEPSPEGSSKSLPKADVKDAVVAAPENKAPDAEEPKAKGKPDSSDKPAVIENPTGAEKLSQAAVPQTHPSDAAGAANYPDLQGKSFPSQSSSVIGANEEVKVTPAADLKEDKKG